MNYSKVVNLGIVACPGGEAFCDTIVDYLKRNYTAKHRQKVELIAKAYGISRDEAEAKINMQSDILDPDNFDPNKDIHAYECPEFKIPTKCTRFANGEFKTEILSSVRGMDVFIIQDCENHYPIDVNGDGKKHVLSVPDHAFILFATIDAVIQSGARSVNVVVPVYPFARQHERKGREALTASLFGRILEYMGVKKIITLDIHSKEIENSFNRLRMENLHASYQIIRELSELVDLEDENLVIVSPDTGAVDRNKFYANNLNKPLALIYKERDYSKVTGDAKSTNIVSMKLLGNVKGKTVFMADDMLGTGGTLIEAMKHLKAEGAEKIICAISLPLFTGKAIESFDEAYKQGYFTKLIGTNAVYHGDDLLSKEWYVSASVSDLFARIISRLHQNRPITPVVDNKMIIQQLIQSKK
ncbi:MAG: ribose-phosphate diphosphokinase [Spirochaetia bacterium]|jgi:ribose-phosphate pyrophosphokinase|nr:ribose-phosphate diphosphokinase [Spirochaetia bacterium]